jgi:molybdate transport system substrate-binding protein
MSAAAWLLLASFVASPLQAAFIVSAAVSLTDALTEIGAAYEADGGAPVRFNFAASNVLARQIVHGAPVDMFISADNVQMDMVERAGLIDPSTRSELLQNWLAVVTRAGTTSRLRAAADLTGSEIRRIAIGNPEAVPAGAYARVWLTNAGVWDKIQHKIVPVGSVRAALAAVEGESVDAAIVYRSDTAHLRSAALAFVVTSGAPRISYPVAILRRTARADEARRFIAFIRDRRGQQILIKHQFPGIVR